MYREPYREADILIIASQQGDYQYICVPGSGYIYNLPARDRFFDEKVQDKYIHFTIFCCIFTKPNEHNLNLSQYSNKVGFVSSDIVTMSSNKKRAASWMNNALFEYKKSKYVEFKVWETTLKDEFLESATRSKFISMYDW